MLESHQTVSSGAVIVKRCINHQQSRFDCRILCVFYSTYSYLSAANSLITSLAES